MVTPGRLGGEFANATLGCHTGICSYTHLPLGALYSPNASLAQEPTRELV